jgi:predicted NAD-dependent protein-ADP-ribosyltransferase YbiA (DUF1768 family)
MADRGRYRGVQAGLALFFNFAPVSVQYDETDFLTSEHAYQAAKARNEPDIF